MDSFHRNWSSSPGYYKGPAPPDTALNYSVPTNVRTACHVRLNANYMVRGSTTQQEYFHDQYYHSLIHIFYRMEFLSLRDLGVTEAIW